MTDADFLPVILADPGDDAPRLVYADWLDEHGDNAGRLRAEFIRVQCELARREAAHLPPGDPCTCTRTDEDFWRYRQGTHCAACRRRNGPIEALRRRERELLTPGNGIRWLAHYPGLWATHDDRGFAVGVGRMPGTPIRVEFRRGFVERVTLTAGDCLRHLDAVLERQPVRHVTLTTRPLFEFHPGHPSAVRLIDAPRRLTLPVYSDYLTAEAEKKLLELTWQGVTFEPPPTFTPHTLRAASIGFGGPILPDPRILIRPDPPIPRRPVNRSRRRR